MRKLTFVTAYTIGLYIHFFINLSVAIYLLYVILHATRADAVALCQHALTNAQSQNQCDTLFDTIRGVYAGLASFILIVELCESIRLTSLVIKSHSHRCPYLPSPEQNQPKKKKDGAIVGTRYVYTLRRQKREARKPKPTQAESASREGWRTLPGFMRYRDASGATVYDSYYFPPANKGHSRGASTYSLADSDLEGATPLGLYDPPSAGLPGPKDGMLDFEDEYKDDDREESEYKDDDRDSMLDPPPGLPSPWGETGRAVRRDSADTMSEYSHT